MKKDILIGIDAGTSMIKSVAFSLTGDELASASVANSYEVTADKAAEQDMDRTWADCLKTLKQLVEKMPGVENRVAAIAVTGQGDGTWLADENGESVAPGWLWLDARAASLVEELRARDEDHDRFQLTGTGLLSCQQGAQLAWMAKNSPEILNRAAHSMHCKDWLYYKLTGIFATDPSEALFTFGDYKKRTYSDEVIEHLGLKKYRHLLPQIVDGVKEVHALTKAAAKASGLLEGTPVSLGYVDVLCTGLGGGLYEKNSDLGCSIIGTTGMHMRMVSSPDGVHLNEDRTGYTMAMPIDGVYAQIQSNMSASLNVDWILNMAVDVFAMEGIEKSPEDFIKNLDGLIESAAPAQLLYQPYISQAGERGPFVNALARGGFSGLHMGLGFKDMLRGVAEGMAFASRDCYSAMGALPKEIRIVGGAARSNAIRSIFSSVMGAGTRTSSRGEAGAAGAAMIAAVAIGIYENMDSCVKEWTAPLLSPLEPHESDETKIYDAAFETYLTARKNMDPVWQALNNQKGML